MAHVIKIRFQIYIDDTCLAFDYRLCYPIYRLMSCPLRAITVRTFLKIRFKNRLQYQFYGSLNNPVTDARYPQGSEFSITFGNKVFSVTHRTIRLLGQFATQLLQKLV